MLFRSEVANLPKTLNGPHGNVSSQTVVSVEMLKYGPENQVSELCGYDSLNLLSCWTTQQTLETQLRKAYRGQPVWAAYYSLGMLYSNVL